MADRNHRAQPGPGGPPDTVHPTQLAGPPARRNMSGPTTCAQGDTLVLEAPRR